MNLYKYLVFTLLQCSIGALASNLSRDTTQNVSLPVFTHGSTGQPDLVFSMSASTNGSLALYLAGTSKHSWIAVGTGTEMQDSMMFIVYGDKTKHGATLSTRYSTGENEPKYMSNMDPEANASHENGFFTVDAHYHNSSSWMQHHIDMSSNQQPFIFALGPKLSRSNGGSPSATIQRHVVYGRFTMDMTKAVSDAAPTANGDNGAWVRSGASEAYGVSSDYDVGSAIHAVVMCLAFVLVFPLGALLLRFISVRVHYMVQLAASILVIIGLGTGVYISTEYNRTKNYNTAHQIVGLIVFVGVAIQLILGTVHHVIYKRTRRATKLGKIHLYLGPLVLVLGIINAPLGTIVGQRSQYNIPYAVVVAVLAVLFFAARIYIWRSTKQNKTIEENSGSEGSEAEAQVPLHMLNSTTKLT
ncbi:CBD9-like protein, partial [Aureobasidium melanogenum]